MNPAKQPSTDAGQTASSSTSSGPAWASFERTATERTAAHARSKPFLAPEAHGAEVVRSEADSAETLGGPHYRPEATRRFRSISTGNGMYAPAIPTPRPAPLPKRPKGRFVIGLFLLSVIGTAGYLVWNATLRFEAYGVVVGQVVDVAPTWSGVLESIQVREGDEVRQDQLLATLKNLALEHRRADLLDELRITQAAIDAELAEIRLDAQSRRDQALLVFVDYWELQGNIAFEQSQLERYVSERQRLESLMTRDRQAVSAERLEEVLFSEKGHRSKIEKMMKAVEELKARVEQFSKMDDVRGRLHPQQIRLETLAGQLSRLTALLREREIRAPVNGRIVKLHRFAGEYAEEGKPICELLVDGSLTPVLYIPQEEAARYSPGAVVDVEISPRQRITRCQVKRVAAQLEEAPKCLQVYYRHDQPLLPVVLQPLPTTGGDVLRLGSQLRVPTDWRNWR